MQHVEIDLIVRSRLGDGESVEIEQRIHRFEVCLNTVSN